MLRPLMLQIELVLSLVKRDLKARYKESVLGFFWSLLRPAVLTVVLWVVFSILIPVPLPAESVPFWMHVLISVLTWNFFFGSVTEATHSIVANGNLLKKVPLNALVFPVAAVGANGVHFVLALVVALGVVAVAGPGFTPALLLLPLVALLTALLALGIGMILGALNVFYRDTGSALELLGMAWFYATPVIYPATLARMNLSPEKWGEFAFPLYMANPAAPLLVAMRRTILYAPPHTEIPDPWLLAGLAWTALVSVLLIGFGWVLFRRIGGNFADEL